MMSSFQLGLNLVLTFVLASLLLFRYGNWYRHHVVITLAVLVAWYFSFIIIFVLPIDVSTVSQHPPPTKIHSLLIRILTPNPPNRYIFLYLGGVHSVPTFQLFFPLTRPIQHYKLFPIRSKCSS